MELLARNGFVNLKKKGNQLISVMCNKLSGINHGEKN